MFAYLRARPAVRRENRAPDAPFPFSWRGSVAGWKLVNFTPKIFDDAPEQSEAWRRGRYLVEAAAHCGECHTPRTLTGGLDTTMALAGSVEGPEGQLAPNITPHDETGNRVLFFAMKMALQTAQPVKARDRARDRESREGD